ncbi:MAG: hypothetical protein LBT55_03490 [Clostridiaceae bacterium]|jgi:hypothetical protein|nr:hypothetical protein [Clostridiaceae bacterium]
MDIVTRAKINLFAVLRNLQELCTLDKASQEAIKDANLSVGFKVPSVGEATLVFKDGKCTFRRGDSKSSLKLIFLSAEHFNKLIDGGKTIPIFFNVFQAGFLLKTFITLADRLSYYLQPEKTPAFKDQPEKLAELLKDQEYFNISTTLTACTAFFALCEVGNSDPIGKLTAARIPDGVISCTVKGGPALNITVGKDHVMTAALGEVSDWRASMEFADMQFASDILRGKTDTFTGMGTGKFAIKGFVPMLENMAKLLAQVAFYLK